ncbi:MAG: hypothetical protein IPO87_02100 [Flavobacteriales bacterium]|nr:hypothetical protein [Flavobacteriales bacterium]
MRNLMTVLVWSMCGLSFCQTSEYFGGMDLHDGIYLRFSDFKYNTPSVPLEQLRDAQGLTVPDIRQARGKLQWQPDSGEQRTVDLQRIWGFCQNDVVYIAGGNGFFRIGLMGSISHMVVEQTYRDWNPYMSSYGQPYGSTTRTVLVQQLLDMETGNYLPFNASGMDQVLQHDPVLLEEFRALPKKGRNRDEALFRFMRLYNDRHPLFFPAH